MRHTPSHLVLIPVLALVALGLPAVAGDLEPPGPPGPPGPTMGPLPELEPRRPIVPEMMPLTITEPGSYYLLDNVDASAGPWANFDQ